MFLKLKRFWCAIRWKMLTIFVFFSVISMILVGCFAVAVVNVVIRRESAYLVEERIKVVVHQRKELIDSFQGGVGTCPDSRSNSLQPLGHPDGGGSENQVTVLPWRESGRSEDVCAGADASILPRVTTGNTMAPCVVIGERASELLRSTHKFLAAEAHSDREAALVDAPGISQKFPIKRSGSQ